MPEPACLPLDVCKALLQKCAAQWALGDWSGRETDQQQQQQWQYSLIQLGLLASSKVATAAAA